MPAISSKFPSAFVGRCWVCQGEISLFDAVAFDQDSQIVHEYCA